MRCLEPSRNQRTVPERQTCGVHQSVHQSTERNALQSWQDLLSELLGVDGGAVLALPRSGLVISLADAGAALACRGAAVAGISALCHKLGQCCGTGRHEGVQAFRHPFWQTPIALCTLAARESLAARGTGRG